jgi:adenosylcobinamide-phosphate synthase
MQLTASRRAAKVRAMFWLVPESSIDPFFILLAGLAVDAVFGDMRPLFRFLPHPVVALGGLIASLERRLNRESRSAQARRVRGLVVVAAVVAIAAAAGWAVLVLTRHWRWGWAVEIFLVGVLVAQRSLYDHVFAVCRALETGGLAAGREAVRHIVGRDPNSLDDHGVARAGIESLFENFSDGVVAPAFWYVLFGLPGLLAYKAANTLDSMIGHRSPRYLDFGAAAARLDTAANFVPARLAGAIIAAAALIAPKANPAAALKTMWRDARKHRSVNAGWPEAAAAGALGLALAGPRRYGADLVNDAWIGDGRARVTTTDMRAALYLFVVACLVHAALIALLALAWHQP